MGEIRAGKVVREKGVKSKLGGDPYEEVARI
jgi:hypothetical protein